MLKALHVAFRSLDANGDGRISERDIELGCRKLGIFLSKEDMRAMIQEADADNSGTIEYREFERLVGRQLVVANYRHKELQRQFRLFDKDGDGFITGEEIRAVFRESGVDMPEEEVAALIAEADTDGDGVISFEEFVHSVCEKDW
ncbi:CALM-like protein [Mya arenaria]|uniref:CALM-like protein n=1 Tax=Mya arenaria TaxID=6604 RepID=A0ABY7F8M6_MYAAR|nr:CALM-like protein [Mya arenaria]